MSLKCVKGPRDSSSGVVTSEHMPLIVQICVGSFTTCVRAFHDHMNDVTSKSQNEGRLCESLFFSSSKSSTMMMMTFLEFHYLANPCTAQNDYTARRKEIQLKIPARDPLN